MGMNAVSNVENFIVDDCDCCVMTAGSTLSYVVWGALSNPEVSGLTKNWISFCEDDSTLSSLTTIIPYNTTANRSATWGRIKLLYRS